MLSTLTHLQCSRPTCGIVCDHTAPRNLCPQCQGPLLARYDLSAARRTLTREALATRPASMWRYEEVMPGAPPVTLGEGMTPLLRAGRLGQHLGLDRFYIKDEGQNPTASFKARGLSAAVTMARALGIDTIALPSAGNAGGAAAAYAARAGLRCVIAMPSDTPVAIVLECRAFGADLSSIAATDGARSERTRFRGRRAGVCAWRDSRNGFGLDAGRRTATSSRGSENREQFHRDFLRRALYARSEVP